MSAWSTRFATCFGIGFIPIAPGTFASAAALPFGWLLVHAGWKWLLAIPMFISFVVFGVLTAVSAAFSNK